MFSRATQERGGVPPDQDPLHLRIASAAVVLGLLATGFAVVSRDAVAHGGPAAGGGAGGAAADRPVSRGGPLAASGPRQARNAGLRLLGEAAAACQNVAYQGVQIIASLSPAGRSVSVVDIWHKRGAQALIRTTSATTGNNTDTGGDRDSAPILGMTPQMVTLLGARYEVAVAGGSLVDGRPAHVVEVRDTGGRLAARFWVDSATKLPLRREIFGSGAQVISEDEFIDLKLGTEAAAGAPAAMARPRGSPLSGPQLARLRAEGWPVPGPLPGRLSLFQANRTVTASGTVVELAYSDGLSVVSLYVQRGHLPAELSGWSEVALQGQHVYVADPDNRSVAWSADGFVYTVITDTPGQTMDQVVAALRRNARPSLAARLVRGLRRLVSCVDPFR